MRGWWEGMGGCVESKLVDEDNGGEGVWLMSGL